MNSSIRDWQSDTTKRFLHIIQFIQAINFGNQLLSNSADADIHMKDDYVEILMVAPEYNEHCSCALSSSCRSLLSIYNLSYTSYESIPLFSIPNFFIDCFPVDGLFQSTLECFYSRSCMIEIDQHMYLSLGESFNFSALDSNQNWPNETIESIVNRLMIDSWKKNLSYSSYYNTCAPLVCTFDYIGRSNIFVVVMTMISIFGGLSFGLKISFLITLRFVEKMRNKFSCSEVKRIIKSLFICHTKYQIIRRFHFILLVITLCIVYSFFISTFQPTTVQTIKPSFSQYQYLIRDHSNTLQCSCSHLSIKYQSFLTIKPRYHQICSSEFISDRWIEYLYGEGDLDNRFLRTDFRASHN